MSWQGSYHPEVIEKPTLDALPLGVLQKQGHLQSSEITREAERGGASLSLYFLTSSLLERQKRETSQFVTFSTPHISADLISMIIAQ